MPRYSNTSDGISRSFASAALCIFLLTGCSGSKHPAVTPVTGTVIYQDKPVSGAQVTFMPNGARPAQGQTDADGHFKLTTFETADGAVPGDHQVSIAKMVDSGKSSSGYPVLKNVLPQHYQDVQKSGLKVTVKAGEPNDFEFKLKD